MSNTGRIILSHDWKDYDQRKVRERRNINMFSCANAWERRYLASKINLLYPQFDMESINRAIEMCCNAGGARDVTRESFVQCVAGELSK